MVVVAQLVSASGCGPEGRRFKSGLPPHFFCLDFKAKKITKTQVFTSQSRQALLHIFTRRSRSSLKHRSDLLVKTLHFIPLVKAFRYRFTCEVAACRREDVFLFTAHLTVLK